MEFDVNFWLPTRWISDFAPSFQFFEKLARSNLNLLTSLEAFVLVIHGQQLIDFSFFLIIF